MSRHRKPVRLGLETFDDRLVPSVTFTEDSAAHKLTVTAAAGQNNTITIQNDGDGNLTVVADGTIRTFTHVFDVKVDAGDGKDTVTYNQGTSAHEVDIHRDFSLKVDLGSGLFDGAAKNSFTANVFGDVGFFQNGVQARRLGFAIWGGNGADRIAFNFHDTDVLTGSDLDARAFGLGGKDHITLDSDGKVNGNFHFSLQGGDGDDKVVANVLLDTGSNGTLGAAPVAVDVRGDGGDDKVTLAVRQQAGSHAEVNALVDGGLSFFDHDVGRHTDNVRTAYLEEDITVN